MKQRRGIRSILFRAGIFLLLGAIANVAVAWGCATWCEFGPTTTFESLVIDDYVLWQAVTTSHWCGELRNWEPVDMISSNSDDASRTAILPYWQRLCDECAAKFGRDEMRLPQWGTFDAGLSVRLPLLEALAEAARGWPLLTLWGVYGDLQLTGIEMSDSAGEGRFLPLVPIWPGFAINTLFYAAILWLLYAVLFALRRMRRIKRGLCPACAYPVGASDLCTECGTPIPSSLRGEGPRIWGGGGGRELKRGGE